MTSNIQLQLTIPESLRGQRLDVALSALVPDYSRSRLQQWIRTGQVTLDARVAQVREKVSGGERVRIDAATLETTGSTAEAIALDIVHADADLLVVNKPAGLVMHPAAGNPAGTLLNALLHHDPALAGLPRAGIVHRLDKDTSGLLVVALTDEAHRLLAHDLARRRVKRGYVAAAWGHLDSEDRTLDLPLGRDPRNRKLRAVVEGGRRAVTHVRRLERWTSADLVAVRLETGRTHQIRVHFKAIGHPVVGDPLYAPGWERGFLGAGGRWAEELARRVGRMFLHAGRLAFRHPITGEALSFDSPLPEPLLSARRWARETS